MAKRIEFTIIIFLKNGTVLKYRTVTNYINLLTNIGLNDYAVDTCNIYRKKTKQFLQQIKTCSEWLHFYNNLPSKFE